MKRTYLSFGLIAGIIIIIYASLVFAIMGDFDKMTTEDFLVVETLGYLRYLIMILAIVFAIRSYKKQMLPVIPAYGQLLKTGAKTTLVIAILIGIMEGCTILIYPDLFNQMMAIHERSNMDPAKLESIRAEYEGMKWMFTPWGMGLFYFVETFVIGFIASLIVALLFNKRHQTRPAL